jgi:hypothetical protein
MNGVLRLGLVALLLALLYWQVDLPLVLDYLEPGLLIAAMAIQPTVAIVFILGALRLRLLLGAGSVRFSTVMKALLLSNGMNLLLPGRLSELLKVTYLRDHAGTPASAGLAAVFLERLIDVIILGLLALVGVSLALADPGPGFAVLTVAAVAVLLALPRLERIVPLAVRILPGAWVREGVIRISAHLAARVKDYTVFGALGYGACMWLVSLANAYVFLRVCGDSSIGLHGALVVFVLSIVGGAIPALPGGFGTYEAAVVFALKGYGYTLEEALPIALALHASQLVIGFSGALAIAATESLGIRALSAQIAEVTKADRNA